MLGATVFSGEPRAVRRLVELLVAPPVHEAELEDARCVRDDRPAEILQQHVRYSWSDNVDGQRYPGSRHEFGVQA